MSGNDYNFEYSTEPFNTFITPTISTVGYINYTDVNNSTSRTPFQYKEKIFGDFSAFYVTITICTVLGAFLFALNIILCCCSSYKKYWQDSNTGKYVKTDFFWLG